MARIGRGVGSALVFLVMILVKHLEAHDMTMLLINDDGPYCAKLRCWHPSDNDAQTVDVPLAEVGQLSLDYLNPLGSYNMRFTYDKDTGELVEVDMTGIHEFNGIIEVDLFEYSVYLSLAEDCATVENWGCYMEYNGQYTVAPARIIDEEESGGGDAAGDDETLSIAEAVIRIMSTVANNAVEFGIDLDNTADRLDLDITDLEINILTGLQDFRTNLSLSAKELEEKLDRLGEEGRQQLSAARSSTEGALSAASGELEDSVRSVDTALGNRIDQQGRTLNDRVTELNDQISNELVESDQSNADHVAEATTRLQASLDGLGLSVTELGESTTTQINATSTSMQTLITTDGGDSAQAFSDAITNITLIYDSLVTSLSSDFTILQTGISESLADVKQTLDNDNVAYGEAFTLQQEAVVTSFAGISTSLNEAITNSNSALVTSVTNINSDIEIQLSTVQGNLDANLATLQESINTQLDSTGQRVDRASRDLNNLISEASTSSANQAEALNDFIDEAIRNSSSDVGSAGESLQAGVEDLNQSTANGLTGVENDVTQSFSDINNQLSSDVDNINEELTTTVENLVVEVLAQPDADAITSGFNQSEADLSNGVDVLYNGVSSDVNTLSISTSDALTQVNDGVIRNIDTVKSEVENLDESATQELNNLRSVFESTIQATSEAINADISNLDSASANSVDTLSQNIQAAVSGLETSLNTAVDNLEKNTLELLDSLKALSQSKLDQLAGEAGDISTQTDVLEDVIAGEKAKITALLEKYILLDGSLVGVDGQVDQAQQALGNYATENQEGFNSASLRLDSDSQATLEQLVNVNTKISDTTVLVEAATEDFVTSFTQLGDDIQGIGDNLTLYLDDNVGDILNVMIDTTGMLTSYLQPSECERNMQYASITNNQYVIIYPTTENGFTFDVLCDTSDDGGGWIVIQRRLANDVSFYKGWDYYKEGFGTIETDFYLGNDNIYDLTTKNAYELRVTIKYNNQEYFADYDTFSIGNEDNLYALQLGEYVGGTAGDSLGYHNGLPFSTFDRDNDMSSRTNCAEAYFGSWWYNDCLQSNLNGDFQELRWYTTTGVDPASFAEMKIRLKE